MANEISRREGLRALAGLGIAMQVAAQTPSGPQIKMDPDGTAHVTYQTSAEKFTSSSTVTLSSKGDYKEVTKETNNGKERNLVIESKIIPNATGKGLQLDPDSMSVTITDAGGKAVATTAKDLNNAKMGGDGVVRFAVTKGKFALQTPANAPAPTPEAAPAPTQPGSDPNAPTVEWKDNTTAIVHFQDKRTVEFNRSYGDSVIVQEPKLGTQTVIQYTNATQPHMSRISVDPIGADKSRPPAQYAYFDAAGRYDEDGKSRNDLLPPKKDANRDPYYDPPEKFKQDSKATMQTAMDARTALMNDPRAKAMRWNEKSFPGFEDYGAKAPAPAAPTTSAPKAPGGPKP